MSEHVSPEEEHLLQQLAIVDENPAATVEGTVRQLHAELETLASDVKSLPLADPHQKESACRRAVEQARSVMIEATRSVPAAESPTPLPEYLEHFRILKLLGQGGMGTVYLAEDTRLGRQVALKTLKPELAAWPQAHERFFREARLAATIEHDHVVPIYHVSEANGVPFLAMPCLKGHSLEEMIKTGRKWTPVQIVRLGVQIAEGLAVAHAKGLIHRDIKPGNLWVEPTGGGRVKILDFGLARLEASPGRESGELTQTGAILGTPAYMAPEQARGEKVDARADLYSFGVVLYRLATGRLPLRGTDTISMLMALASEQPQPVQELAPDLPPPLAELIMRLLAKDRNQRPASAREVSHTLRGILESLKTPTPAAQPVPVVVAPAQPVANPRADLDAAEPEKPVAPPRPQSTAKRRKPRRWALVAAGLASLAALILAGVILIIRDREGQEVARIEVKDGNTVEVKDKKVTITPPKAEPKPIDLAAEKDPERCVALWVLSIGGWVTIRDNGQEREILATAALPTTSFEVVCVDLNFKHVTDAGLVHLKDLKGLTALGLRETQVTDAGLVHLKELKGLTYLNLDGTQVTEAGLVHLKELKGLATLELAVPRVTDAGLVYLIKELKGLTGLSLRQTQVTDAGLVHLIKELKGLTNLDLAGTQVTDTGLVHLKELKGLTSLNLAGTRVTDAGLVHLKELKGLTALHLNRTRVSDLSLPWIGAQRGGGHMDFPDTRISRQGYEQLKAAYPEGGAQLTWSERNHDVAQAVLKLGGQVWIAGRDEDEPKLVKHADELIRDYFQVRRVSLAGIKQPLGNLPELLSRLNDPDWDRLEVLELTGQAIPDLNFLQGVKSLTELRLTDARLNDASLGRLPALPKLKKLVLDGNDVRAGGVRHLANTQPQLEELSLARTSFDTPAALQLPELKELRVLNLAGTALTDRGLKEIAKLAKLQTLDLGGTKVSAAGIAELQKALPECKIAWEEKK